MKKTGMYLRILSVSVLLCSILGWVYSASAQSFYGSIVGTVTDSSNAVVAGADVTLTNVGTGERRTVKTSGSGNYEFLNLIPAIYKIDVEMTGFSHLTRDQIQVTVANATRADLKLVVGDVNQTVEVTTQAALLQTDSSDLNEMVEGRQVQDTPLNGRNVFNLVALVPGVVPMGATQGFPVDNTGTSTNPSGFGNYQIGGGIVAQNAIYVDGAADGLSGNNTPLVPTQDAIQEFSVLTSNVPAEFGRFGGGVINLTTKSGTNAFHGTAYEYIRNRLFNANDFFNNRSGLPRPEFTQNQYGATLGGPVIHEKMFFFAAFEGFALRKATPTTYTMPTAAELAGNFAGLPTIYDPLTTCGQNGNPACVGGVITRQPFTNNQIPSNRFDQTALAMQKYWVAPNQPGTVNNYVLNLPLGGNSYQGSIRGDYTLNDKQRLFGRYTIWTLSNSPSDPFHNLTGAVNYTLNTTQAVLGYTYTLSPTLILDLRAAYMKELYPSNAQSLGINMAQFGPAWATLGPQMTWTTYPGETITGGFRSQSGGGQVSDDDDYFYSGSVTKILGKHTIKAGGDLKHDLALNQNGTSSGTFNFDATFTSSNATNSTTSGSGFADFILGAPTTGSMTTYARVYTFLTAYGLYVSDTYQIHPRLTLNLGLRWEQPGAEGEVHNNDMILDLTAPDPIGTAAGLPKLVGQPELVASTVYPSSLESKRNWNNFGPRVGFAWRANTATVVRGGFGIEYLPYLVSKYPDASAAVNSSVTTMTTTTNGGQTPANYISNPFPSGLIQPKGRAAGFLQTLEGGNIFGTLPYDSQKSKSTMQWNLSVQRDLGRNNSLTLTYAATMGRHLYWGGSSINLNQIPDQYDVCGTDKTQAQCNGHLLSDKVTNPFYNVLPSSVGVLGQPTLLYGYLLRPFPQFLNVQTLNMNIGSSSYNALQVSYQKRFKGEGTIAANYTWSKFISNTEAQTGSGESDLVLGGIQDYTNPHADRSISGGNVPQRLVINYVYDLPFGKGRHFLNKTNGVTNQLVGGWTVGGITSFADGFPLSLTSIANQLSSTFGAGTIRPNLVAGCNPKLTTSPKARLGQWFNTSCFTQPGSYSFGNYPRVSPNLRAAGIANYDFNLTKNFVIREGRSLEFDSQFFNIFNREMFAAPAVQAGNASFGQVTATSPTANPRLIQFAARLRF